jgi:hypothetical protein
MCSKIQELPVFCGPKLRLLEPGLSQGVQKTAMSDMTCPLANPHRMPRSETSPPMSRHGSQERMEAGSPSAAPLSAPLGSSQTGPVLRSFKRRRISGDGSCSTDMGSVVTAFCETFDRSSNTAYKHWLETVQPTAASHEYASLVTKKVAAQANGVCTTGTIQCLRQGLLQSMTRTLPANTILPNKSQPFSIVWADNTD